MGPRLHGVASRTGKIESRAGKVEGRRFLRLKFRRTRYHNRSHAMSSRRVACPLGQMLRCRVTAGEGTDMPERSAARGGVDIDLLQGGPRVRIRLPPAVRWYGAGGEGDGTIVA